MSALVLLASSATADKTWWNPYVKGGMIALFAILLFVGSAYLLLYTNVGSRLGFLLTTAAFTGFIAMLAVFWLANEFVTGPKGRLPGWPIKEMVSDLSESRYDAVRTLEEEGSPAESAQAGQIRAQLDEQLATDAESRFKQFRDPTDFVVVETLTRGGGRKWPIVWSKNTRYGAALVCPAKEVEVLPLEPPPPPECDTTQASQWAVVIEDLGAERLPQVFFLVSFSALFGLSLLALHRYEKEQAEANAPQDPPAGGGDGPNGDTPSPAEPEPANA